MRELTKEQKKLLTKWFKETKPTEKEKLFGIRNQNELNSFEDLSLEQIEQLTKINDTEVLFQNVNYFLNELKQNE